MLNSLKSKVLAAQIGIAMFISLSIGVLSYYFMLGSMKDIQQSEIEMVANFVSNEIQDHVRNKKYVMESITESREFQDYKKYYRDLPLAQHFAKFKNSIPNLSYISKEGIEEVKIIGGKKSDDLENYSDDPCVQRALSSLNQVVILPPDGKSDHNIGTIKLGLAKTDYFGDEFTGILMGYIPLSDLSNTLLSMNVGETGFLSVIDKSGRIMYHPRPDKILTRMSGEGEQAEQLIREAVAMQKGFIHATLMDLDAYIAFHPVNEMEWSVMAIMPYDEFNRAPNKLGVMIMVISLGAFVIAYRIASSLSGHIMKPLKKLAAASEAVARGNLSHMVNFTTKDAEIKTLIGSFNKMTESLSQTLISRDYMENIFASMTDSMVIIDGTDAIRAVNTATLDLLGYRKKELIAKPASVLFGEEAGEEIFRSIRDKLINEQYIRNYEVTYETRDSTKIPLLVSCAIMTDKVGTGYDIVLAGKDISDLKKTQDKLNAHVLHLRETNRELQDFAHIASHDLQEPARKIMAFSDRLKTGYAGNFDDRGLDYIERMQNAARRMQSLIDSLLMYSRVTSRARPFVPTALSDVVAEVLSDLEDQITEQGGQVTIDNLPVIEADPFQMRQLFYNLIGNALKFCRTDVKTVITISGNGNGKEKHNQEDALCHATAEITVTDNGIGFDNKYKDRIFSVFQRLHGHSEYEGAGIGLSVCKKIIKRHSGSIQAKSSPGEGSAFTVTLPVKQKNGGNYGLENSVDYHTHG